MASRKLASSINIFTAFSAVFGLTTVAASAGGLVNTTLNSVTRTITSQLGGTLGPSGPTGPKGPLISVPSTAVGPGVRIGSSGQILSNENGGLPNSGARPQRIFKGSLAGAKLPAGLAKPLQTTVTAITNDTLTVGTTGGPAVLRVPRGTAAASGIRIGSKVEITADSHAAIVHIRRTDRRPAPYAGVYVGFITEVVGKNVTLRFRDGTLRRFVADTAVLRIVKAAKGETVALASNDGLFARKLLTSKELNSVLAAIPKIQKRYIGRIIKATDSAVSLDLGDGTVQTLQCSTCAGRTLNGISLVPGLAVYAIGDPQGRLTNLAAIPDGTRIVGQITSSGPRSVSIMLGSGDIANLACACANVLPNLGDITVGDPIIVNLDRNASVTSLVRFPEAGRMVGQILSVTASQITLKLASGQIQSFGCNCLGGLFDLGQLRIGNTVAVMLNSDAQVSSVSSPNTTATTAASIPPSQKRTVCKRWKFGPVRQTGKGQGNSTCADGDNNKVGAQAQLGVPASGLSSATLRCANQDSANIFVAVRHWYSQSPVSGAAVNLSGPASITVMTPPSGYFELRGVPAGKYRLSARKAGLVQTRTALFTVGCNEGIRVVANLRTLPQTVRVVRFSKREVVSGVMSTHKQSLQCIYRAKAPRRLAKLSRGAQKYRAAHGYYTCGVRRMHSWRTSPR
ncbi:MAG: carboxypeptidase-like regulatory domain-containing protein [Candidatus Eremiobacteraeota bacterium]|nr:carboxypeptidase-like regulatory domain-containing protein [Candidatus Eremiobacteraeota bacterium]